MFIYILYFYNLYVVCIISFKVLKYIDIVVALRWRLYFILEGSPIYLMIKTLITMSYETCCTVLFNVPLMKQNTLSSSSISQYRESTLWTSLQQVTPVIFMSIIQLLLKLKFWMEHLN